MRSLILLLSSVTLCAAQTAPLQHTLKETTTRPTYVRSAEARGKWAVQDFTTTVQGGALLVAVERDPRLHEMCYAVTDHDQLDASYFAVHVPCAEIR